MRDAIRALVHRGDTITVRAQGRQYTGTVDSASFYHPDGWYIEFTSQDGPHYWKQPSDGGSIVSVNGVPYAQLLTTAQEAQRA